MADRDWMTEAACTSTDPEIFFPDGGVPSVAATRICGVCPVRRQCADYANATGVRYGIWGGMSTDDRYRRARARQEAR